MLSAMFLPSYRQELEPVPITQAMPSLFLQSARAQMDGTPLKWPWAGGEKEEQNEKDRPPRRKGRPRPPHGAGRGARPCAGLAERGADETGKPRPNTSHGRGATAMNNGTTQREKPATNDMINNKKNLISDKCTQQYFTIVNCLYLQMYIMFTIVNSGGAMQFASDLQ